MILLSCSSPSLGTRQSFLLVHCTSNISKIKVIDRLSLEMSMFWREDRISGNVLVESLTITDFTNLGKPVKGVSNFTRNGGEAWENAHVTKMSEVSW